MTCDTWHVTRDAWHMTRDMFGGWTFSQNFSSLALTICDLWYYEDLEEKAGSISIWMNELINDEAVYRTALAPPGLLKIVYFPKILMNSDFLHSMASYTYHKMTEHKNMTFYCK